jgi:arsenite methyltransferase
MVPHAHRGIDVHPSALFTGVEAPQDPARVADAACGAGVDLLLAARRIGPRGRAIGADMSPAMRDQAAAAAGGAGLGSIVKVRAGLLEDLPVPSASVDVDVSG